MLLELCLIVKDSGDRIVKALESWKKHIDYWTILDTGSTDGTPKRIKQILKDVPGQLFEESYENFTFDCFGNKEIQQRLINKFGKLPFDFAKARNRSLELCSDKCHFIITIDDTYQIINPELLRKKLTNIIDKPHNACLIYIHNQDQGKPETLNFVQSLRIIRPNKGFKWVNSIHEMLDVGDCMVPNITLNHDTYLYDEIDQYHSERSYNRHKRDIEVLTICYDHTEEGNTKARYAYYAAQTSIILNDVLLASKWLQRRIDHNDEKSSELYHVLTQYARLKKDRTYSDRAIEMFPNRIEAYLESALIAYNNKCTNVAYGYLRHGVFCHESSMDKELIFVSMKIDVYVLLTKLALRYGHHKDAVKYINIGLSYNNKDVDLNKAIKICKNLGIWNNADNDNVNNVETKEVNNNKSDKIDNVYEIDEMDNKTDNKIDNKIDNKTDEKSTHGYQEITMSNRSYKRIVFATDSTSTGPWDGNSDNVRGSETSIINIANLLANLKNKNDPIYEVIVFCNTPNEYSVINNVIWRNVTHLKSYLNKNDVDYMISVRSVKILNMLNHYVKTIRNHYFWIHDTGIGEESLCLSQIAFRKMIYVSEFHKSLFMEQFNFPDNLCAVIPNGINTNFMKEISISKVKNRFIYSSDANRGLYELLNLFPIIRKVLPGASLHIYCNLDKTDADVFESSEYKNTCLSDLQKIKKMINKNDYVVHGRCSKKELYQGFAEAEYWFYPCTFVETFCITALEAQYFKCKVICNDLGALKDVVKGGIIYSHKLDVYKVMNKIVTYLSDKTFDWCLEDGHQWAKKYSYDEIIKHWYKLFDTR